MKSLSALLFPSLLAAQCPSNTSPHFSCTSAGGNTQITLFENAELSWESFRVPAEGTFRISGDFSSVHRSTGRSVIAGALSADGAFTLVSAGGIDVSGSITAPEVTLSTLLEVEGGFQALGGPRGLNISRSGEVSATRGNAALLGSSIQVFGNLRASKGKAVIISSDSEIISGRDFSRTPGSTPDNSSQVLTLGSVVAPVVEIYSEGFISNRGEIRGNTISLEAGESITHSLAPGSVIEGQLDTKGKAVLEGRLISPDDGNNPGGVSTTLGFPDLESGSFTGKTKTVLLPSQFSASTVSRSRLPSATSFKNKMKKKTRVVTRGAKSKKKVRKRSFFGVVTKK